MILGLALVGAVVALFYFKGPTGMPLMSVDKLLQDNTPAVLDTAIEVYRWQDAEGIWQFGDNPPDPANAERVEIRPNITPIKTDWVVQVKEQEAAREVARQTQREAANVAAARRPAKSMPELGDVYDGQALQQAKGAARQMEGQTEKLEALMKSIRQ